LAVSSLISKQNIFSTVRSDFSFYFRPNGNQKENTYLIVMYLKSYL